MFRYSFVYILTNKTHRVLYTGVTTDLCRRVQQHREGTIPGFTGKYKVNKLVCYEVSEDISSAIAREKQIKAGSREKKIALVNSTNREWRDLYDKL